MTPEEYGRAAATKFNANSEGHFSGRPLLEGLVANAVRAAIADLEEEIVRLKAGKFTEEEFQNLCHGFQECDFLRFRQGCEEYQAKLFGFSAEARGKRTPEWVEKASKRYEGQTEPCCECGEDYPKADLIFRSEIYCPKCREAEKARKRP